VDSTLILHFGDDGAVTPAATCRTLGRVITRAELWNGNREELRDCGLSTPNPRSCSAAWWDVVHGLLGGRVDLFRSQQCDGADSGVP
jgi:hypothetical protein